MKGERIIGECIALLSMIIYVVALQHLYAELLHEPDRSWLRMARMWWITRHSEKHRAKVAKIWDADAPAAEEP